MSEDPICFFDGELVPESSATVPVAALGSQIIYETARSYGGQPLMLEEHIHRMYQGCHYFGFELGMSAEEMAEAARRTLEANLDEVFVQDGGDYTINIKVSGRPLVYISVASMLPLFRERARYFREGVAVMTASSQRHVPPQCIDPRLKIPRPWFQLAIRETRLNHPECWPYPLMLDLEGNLTEFAAGNLFLVVEGELHTPSHNILLGCSRQVVMEVAREAGIPVVERRMNLWDLVNADEAIMTGTTYGLLPVASCDRLRIGTHHGFGPVSQRIHDRYSERVGIDLAAQYLKWEDKGE